MTTWEIIKYILIYILIGAGVYALVNLGILIFHLAKAIKSVRSTFDDNKDSIDHTLSVLPEVIENVSDITYNVGEITEKGKPEIQDILVNIKNVTADVSGVTGNAKATSDEIAAGIKKVTDGISEVGDKTKEIANIVSNGLQRIGFGAKKSFFETKKDFLARLLDVIDSIRR